MLEKEKIIAAVSSSATTSNGLTVNKGFIETATTQIKTITSESQTVNAMKKKSKKNKNKSKNLTTINNEKNTASCDRNSSTKIIKNVTTDDNDDVAAISQDLLTQLKINGSLHKEIASSNTGNNKTDSTKSKQNSKKLPNKQANGSSSDAKHTDGQHKNDNSAQIKHLINECNHSNGLAIDDGSSAIVETPKSDNKEMCNGIHFESDKSGQLKENEITNEKTVEQKSIAHSSTFVAAAETPIESISPSQLPKELPNISEKCSKQIPTETSSTDTNAVKNDKLPSTPVETTSPTPSASSSSSTSQPKIQPSDISFIEYENELQMPDIMRVIQKDLSEPYSIYTYRYFIHNWPKLCFLAMHGNICIGAIVCKLDIHRQMTKRGYIAMLAVDKDYRKLKVGTTLVQKAIHVSIQHKTDSY